MGRARSEISVVMAKLSSVHMLVNNPNTGKLVKPHATSAAWATIEQNMHRLLVLRGLIEENDRLPEDPWALFLREFGVSDSERLRVEKENLPESILLTSPRYRRERPQLSQATNSQQHVRFQLPLPRRESDQCR